jgi:hypothetical protein
LDWWDRITPDAVRAAAAIVDVLGGKIESGGAIKSGGHVYVSSAGRVSVATISAGTLGAGERRFDQLGNRRHGHPRPYRRVRRGGFPAVRESLVGPTRKADRRPGGSAY